MALFKETRKSCSKEGTQMKVTDHFSVEEFACHDGTEYPNEWITDRLAALCETLETIREALGGKPVTVLSGYRTLSYNKKIGGAHASQHMTGRAADISVASLNPLYVHDAVLKLYRDGKVFIGGLGQYPTFTHIDIRPGQRLARWSGSRTEN